MDKEAVEGRPRTHEMLLYPRQLHIIIDPKEKKIEWLTDP